MQSGGYSEEVTPVPIPNTVVKLLSADGTWRVTARENMSPPELRDTPNGVSFLYFEAEACLDHIHMPVQIPPKISLSSFLGYLKGKSSLMIFDKHGNMKYRYGNREFWCREYYVDTVGKNKKAIESYIGNQLQENLAYEQMSIKELVDPFTGESVKKSRLFAVLSVPPVTATYSRRANYRLSR